ncbi:glycerophosphodiester phosphodiesterase [Thioalkalivibrio denitrificans]|uniref:Glycerophosphodiester phosphodiesterase n=1 Tax=Thioalkalivibrio denitrificans TaxID=108003 RepID=A0A1V3NQF4_9GAMM|nr:glycerophosphodiester phosphodiesterase family protein [Thioalkalivibrio denitrificans]OOG27193.1 glycerophosphodiester phosphodiesterase [Thioalkalivibrio denitrificans]
MAQAVPELIAHRGYAARFPENSLPGMEAAIRCGARYVEMDVQLSADGVPVLFHDKTLHRVCGLPGAVHEFPLATLMTLAAPERDRFGERYADNRLVSLAQVVALLEMHPHVTAFAEIKRVAVERFGVQPVLDAVLAALSPVAARCVLISFSVPLLAEASRRTDIDAFATNGGEKCGLGGVVSRWADREHLSGMGLGYLFCNVRGLPKSGPLAFESAQLAVYEVNDANVALALAARGVRFIETFDLPGLRERLPG